MNKILTLLVALAFATTAFAQQELDLPSFDEIALRTSATVYLTQGSPQKVTVEGDEDDLEELEIEVNGDRLEIKRKGSDSWFNWGSSGDITVYVTVPKIDGISVSGSGKIIGENKINAGDLDLSVSGSGKMELDTENEFTDISISGSGSVYLKGQTAEVEMSISGSGRIRGEDFKAKVVKAKISGSGSCEIHAVEEIDARISGSGSIYYTGSPDKVNSSTSGSGRVKKM